MAQIQLVPPQTDPAIFRIDEKISERILAQMNEDGVDQIDVLDRDHYLYSVRRYEPDVWEIFHRR